MPIFNGKRELADCVNFLVMQITSHDIYVQCAKCIISYFRHGNGYKGPYFLWRSCKTIWMMVFYVY